MKQRGFTLIELLLGLIVSGILASLAVPSFKGLLDSQQRQNAAHSLAQGLRFARMEAITRNRPVVIYALGEDWSQGWRVILDLGGRGDQNDDSPVLLERQDSGRVSIVGNGPVKSQVRFSGLGEPVFSGGGFRAGTVHICATEHAQSLHQVVLAPSGRISLRSEMAEQAQCRGQPVTLALRAANEPAVPWASRR
ncbi:GspH/FimT family pseudopilin [Pseudomonas poae]|uniref:Type II secretion system protein H n=1 Tax=Pseudomonas poae TaxID=200451 RepID=A0A2S9ENX1_9PSED|nr:GspH/FimT family pseudopilin [Pseudomonas poae]PRA26320.1 general secretion pathway protein GspH [Pseudomonas poae]PRC17240.1 general secretion pathway protein GspH [Pseudomonas poae]